MLAGGQLVKGLYSDLGSDAPFVALLPVAFRQHPL